MILNNLTNPGVAPVDGDWVEYVYGNGAREQKAYFAPLEPEEPPKEPIPVFAFYLDIGPFFDRFGTKKLPVLVAAKTDPLVGALIDDIKVRKWVDIQNEQVGQGLDILIQKGLITADDKAIILSPIQPEENLALRTQFYNGATFKPFV